MSGKENICKEIEAIVTLCGKVTCCVNYCNLILRKVN